MKSVLLNDASALLNLLATEHFAEIASLGVWQFAICTLVRDEAKKLRDRTTGELVDIDLSGFIASGLLLVLDFDSEDEQARFVDAAAAVDDGEAMSLAIASKRSFDLAMDDRKAIRFASANFPNVRIWTTPEILKHWAEHSDCEPSRLGQALRDVQIRARYVPSPAHPLFKWWTGAKAF